MDVDAALGILQHLDKSMLQGLLDDEDKLLDIIKDSEQVKSIKREKEMLTTNIRSLAEYNLAQEPRLSLAKDQLGRVYENAVEYQKKYDESKQKLDYIAAQQNLETTLALLQTRAAEAEEETEEMVNEFLSSATEVEGFIEDYVPKRTEAHRRKVKAEKMSELLRNRNQSSRPAVNHSTGAYYNMNHQIPPPGQAAPPGPTIGGWNAPYPATSPALHMPNPSSYL